MINRAKQSLPIADIHIVENQDESIAIYHAAPYRLEKMKGIDAPALLKRLYSKEKGKIVTRETFIQGCKPLQAWLKAK